MKDDDLCVRDKIRAGHYTTKLEYPERPEPRPKNPEFPKGIPATERTRIFEAFNSQLSAFEEKERLFKEAMIARRADEGRLYESFKEDTLAELDITKHPKAERLWSLAWERGHATGFMTVLEEAEELVDLLDPVPTGSSSRRSKP